jgi:hypothetical protein
MTHRFYTPPLLRSGPRQLHTSDCPSPSYNHFAWDFLRPVQPANILTSLTIWTTAPCRSLRSTSPPVSYDVPGSGLRQLPLEPVSAHISTVVALFRFDCDFRLVTPLTGPVELRLIRHRSLRVCSVANVWFHRRTTLHCLRVETTSVPATACWSRRAAQSCDALLVLLAGLLTRHP